jgi:integrase/recombinase XerD
MREDRLNAQGDSLGDLVGGFLAFARAELQFSVQTIQKYRDCLRQVCRMVGDRKIDLYTRTDVTDLKARMLDRGLSVSRQIQILSAFKRILLYGRDELGLTLFDPELITVPTRPRRDVVFLDATEVTQFVEAIPIVNLDGSQSLAGLRFRALVEVLLGTAMRIGEVLSLDREQVNLVTREAKIVGKGNKERVVFFTERSIQWLKRYLCSRCDDHPALFACLNGRSRLNRDDIWRSFAIYRRRAGLTKAVTPHLLRHTAATQLLFNGCPIGHIKEILGHERLETTCRYYLGLDRRAAKQAHQQYLTYDQPREGNVTRNQSGRW